MVRFPFKRGHHGIIVQQRKWVLNMGIDSLPSMSMIVKDDLPKKEAYVMGTSTKSQDAL